MKIDWNLNHLYKNDEEWKKDYKKVEEKIKLLDDKKDIFLQNEQDFKEFLVLKFEIDELIEKLYCYAKRHLDIDYSLKNYQVKFQKSLDLYNSSQNINTYFEKQVVLNDKKIKEYLKNLHLKTYQRYLYLIIRRKEHLGSNDSNYRKELQNLKDKYQYILNSEENSITIQLSGQSVNINRNNYNSLIMDSNQNNRKLIFDAYTKIFSNIQNELCDLYISKLKLDIKTMKIENYPDLLSKKLFELELSGQIVDQLINTIKKHLNVMHKYNLLRKKISGLEKFHIYDTSVSLCQIPKIEFSLEEGINIIKNSLYVLGKEYVNKIDKIFKEGWVDVYPKNNKRTMSFTCISYVGVPYILINYDNSIQSVRTLAHEIGHALHTYYSKTNNDFKDYEFSYFLTEIASKVNEILVNEYMIANCNSLEEKKYILNNIISSLGNSLFGQVMLTEFEHNVINKLYHNETIDSHTLNNLYLNISKKYNSKTIEADENIKYGWLKIPHFVMQDTYYLYQYPIGTSIATYIAYKILNNEDDMKNKYLEFLKLGNRVSIKQSLELLGIDLKNGNYIEESIKILRKKINTMEKLF